MEQRRFSIEDKNTVATLIQLGKILCLISFFIPAATLVIRIFDYDLLRKVSYGDLIVMNPLTAICLILISAALWVVRSEKVSKKKIKLSNILCLIVFLLGLAKIITVLFNVPLVLDEIIFPEQLSHSDNFRWNKNMNVMSPITGISLTLLSGSIILINKGTSKSFRVAQFMNYFVSLMALLSIYGYIYNIEGLYAYVKYIPESFHTAISAFTLASGILFLRPHRGSMARIIGQHTVEIVLLRMLAFIIPLFIGYIKIYGENHGWYGKEFGTAIFTSTTFAISMFLIGWKSNIQFKLRRQRQKNENQIKKDRETLKRILDYSPTTISIINIETDEFSFVNNLSKKNFRIEDDDLIGKSYIDVIKKIVFEEDVNLALNRYQDFKKLGPRDVDELTYRVYDKDGKVNWVYSRAICFRFRSYEPVQILMNSINITKEKELQLKLKARNREIASKNTELKKIKDRLEGIKEDLQAEVKKRMEELEESKKLCKDFFEKSFEGILRYSFKDIDGIEVDLSIEEQVDLMAKHTYVAEANPAFAKLHKYDEPEEIIGTPLFKYLKIPKEQGLKILKKFVENGYRLENTYTVHADKDGNPVELITNLTGIVEDNKLYGAWGTEKLTN